jgi:iron complex outermembrane receptor protein
VGAQGAIVVTPEDAADISRKIFAGYVDFAWDVSEQLLLTAAGRFEDYDDSSGSVVSGKVSGRYEINDWFALRGAVSNGFRAPSLAQQAFAQTSTSINLVGGVYVPVLTKVVKTGSSIANALGAEPLDPERSMNYSVGFTLTPSGNLSIAVDAYQIDLDDRITLTGLLSGTGIRNILIANRFSGDQSVRFSPMQWTRAPRASISWRATSQPGLALATSALPSPTTATRTRFALSQRTPRTLRASA